MRSAVLVIGILIGSVVLAVLAVDYWLLDEGEVATLTTHAPGGEDFETQVWLVDGDELAEPEGVLFLRAHRGDAAWLRRLVARSEVELQRDDWSRAYRAERVDDAALRDRLNEAMAEKYGLADRLLAPIFDPAISVPVRLVPDEGRRAVEIVPGH